MARGRTWRMLFYGGPQDGAVECRPYEPALQIGATRVGTDVQHVYARVAEASIRGASGELVTTVIYRYQGVGVREGGIA